VQCLAAGGAASRGACPTWVQCARRRPAVMAAQEGGGESTGRAARLGASGTRDAWGGAGKAGRAVCGYGVRGVHGSARRARARARPKGVAWRGGGARPREEARARGQGAGSGRGERGESRPGVRSRPTFRGVREQGRGEEGEREGKENRKKKEKWGKSEKGKEREICSAAIAASTAAARAHALVGRGAAVGGTRCAE